ncbi:hypothetical protein ACNHE5_08475 [Pandoraea pnomenusa]|uniref:hypothetical protein n=1 Tax=Pandoraea pnomenusa TaxID=93220 RepID=UPI003CF4FDFE
MADEKFISDHKTETFKSMISISVEYYKALLLLNGAAAAGIVASIDKLAKVADMEQIRSGLMFFVWGLVADALAIFFAWIVQNKLHNENIGRGRRGAHTRVVWVVGVLCLMSLAFFCTGALVAVGAVQ